MRIYKDRVYITRDHPGISGFQQWDRYEYRAVSGLRAQGRDRLLVVKELRPYGGRYQTESGARTVVDYAGLTEYLRNEPYQAGLILNPETLGLPVKKGTVPCPTP